MLFSAETGKIIATMDGSYITAIRTACASAMATKLGQPAKRSARNFGRRRPGTDAYPSADPCAQSRKYQALQPSGASAAAVKKEMESQVKCAIDVANSAEEAVRVADLSSPHLPKNRSKSAWLKPGVHINAVGSHRPDIREIDGATLARAKIIVDSRDAIMAECGDILLALKEKSIAENAIHAEIGEVLAKVKPGRTTRMKSRSTSRSVLRSKTSPRPIWFIAKHSIKAWVQRLKFDLRSET